MIKIDNRWQAFAAHLGISLLIFLALIGVILFHWYPGQFIHFGGWQGIRIVAGVDLVLGPLLTLIVFNKAKNKLKFDLSVIATIQTTALICGVYVVEKERPIAQVILNGSVYVLAKADFQRLNIPMSIWDKFTGSTPYPVALDLPNDRQTIIQQALSDTPSIEYNWKIYLDLRKADSSRRVKQKLEWMKTQMKYDRNKGCYWVDISSFQLEGKACFSPTTLTVTAITTPE